MAKGRWFLYLPESQLLSAIVILFTKSITLFLYDRASLLEKQLFHSLGIVQTTEYVYKNLSLYVK
jgi:hypothetical protein